MSGVIDSILANIGEQPKPVVAGLLTLHKAATLIAPVEARFHILLEWATIFKTYQIQGCDRADIFISNFLFSLINKSLLTTSDFDLSMPMELFDSIRGKSRRTSPRRHDPGSEEESGIRPLDCNHQFSSTA
jgi:hypothetical protein